MHDMTEYYDDFIYYVDIATWQHDNCNLGRVPYTDTPVNDELIRNVHLYDVVERKYAGFTQILLDMWYDKHSHPYKHKLSAERLQLIEQYDQDWGMREWMFVFFVHRLTGSGINYAKNPSGYHNSILLHFSGCETVDDMVDLIKNYDSTMFTSGGYQIAPFPKPPAEYKRAGVYFMCEILPDLVTSFVDFATNKTRDFRPLMDWLITYNRAHGCKAFNFIYAAVLADMADFYPEHVNKESHFFYGSNAIECLSYLARKPKRTNTLSFLDGLTDKIREDTGMLPYNSEDVACDYIRWVENYINAKSDYSHLNLDSVWNSSAITNHPYGRQRQMLSLGMVDTFNGVIATGDKILKTNNMSVSEYQHRILL